MSVEPSTKPLTADPSTDVPAGGRRTSRDRLVAAGQTIGIAVVLLLIVLTFSALEPEAFATPDNFRNIAIDASGLLIVAVGMTFVIIIAGIDLSVGSVLVLASVLSAKAMEVVGGDGTATILVGAVAAVVSGGVIGAVNGVLVTKARVPALVVTLGMLGMALGAAQLLTGGVNLRNAPQGLIDGLGVGRLAGVPWIVLIATLIALTGGCVLRFTRFGRHTYAIGSSSTAARQAGIDVDKHVIRIYTLQGALAGLAGLIALARFAGTTIEGHGTDNLQAIAAVVIGGTSLFGGIGTMFGTVVGVFIPAVLQNGFVIARIQPFWQQVAVGAVLILAVYIDQRRRLRRDRA